MNKLSKNIYKEERLATRTKISFLWACTMFLYIYADIKAFFETDFIKQIMNGDLAGIEVNQSFLLISSMLMTIPPLMIVVTIFIKAKANRLINIVIASLHIVLAASILFFGPEKPWAYYIWYSVFEIIFLILIVIQSVKWPKEKVS